MPSALQKVGYATALLVVGGYAFVHLVGAQGIPALVEKRRSIRALEEQNRKLREENARRQAWIDQLKKNPDVQKRVVREKLHYVEDDEIDFKTPGDPPSQP